VLGCGALGAPGAQAGIGCDEGIGSVRVACSDPPPSFQFPSDSAQPQRRDANPVAPAPEAPVFAAHESPRAASTKHRGRHHARKHGRRH
jgi:hypothetical protein